MNTTLILKLDVSGLPISFVGWHTAARLLTSEKVIWSMGDTAVTLRGGINRQGERSVLELPAIISVSDRSNVWDQENPRRAYRRVIFQRDEGLCMYCGTSVPFRHFQMDHIIPKSRGGPDTYQNLCCSCSVCNDKKKNRTPDEAGMKLLAVPYVPNPAARLILSGRAIIADQMDYLKGYANLRKTRREQ